jgi:hypothetical protein
MNEDHELLIGCINEFSSQMRTYLQKSIAIGIDNTEHEDHLMIAVLRRSIANSMGMIAMAQQRNLFCGRSIVRFQLDTAMTAFGRTLVTDIPAYVNHMIHGNKRGDFEDQHGERMTDSYLHKKLTRKYETVSIEYGYASGFVHFSANHLHLVFDRDKWDQDQELVFIPHDVILVPWSDEDLFLALFSFQWITKIIYHECEEWAKKLPP